MPGRRWTLSAFSLLLLLALLPIASSLRPFVLVITKDDLKDSPDSDPPDDSPDWDDFGDPGSASDEGDHDHDPGSWRPVFEPTSSSSNSSTDDPCEALYISGIRAMISTASSSDPDALDSASSDIEAAASAGHPHAQSVLAFLFGTGLARPQSRPKSFLHHHFAAKAGNMQSKMVLAYTYFRQDLYDKAVELYAELAEAAVASFFSSKEPLVIEPVRIHSGTKENKEALRKSWGEDNEDFQITEYQAHKGNAFAMYGMGLLYYYGLRGVRRVTPRQCIGCLRLWRRGTRGSWSCLGRSMQEVLELRGIILRLLNGSRSHPGSSIFQRTMDWGISMSKVMEWRRKTSPK